MPSDVDKCAEIDAEGECLSTIGSDSEPGNVAITEEQMPEIVKESRKFKELNKYHDVVCRYLVEGIHQAEIIRRLRDNGYSGSKANAEFYIKSLREKYGIVIPKRTSRPAVQTAGIRIGSVVMTQKELMERIWMGPGFCEQERTILRETHPLLIQTELYVKDFRRIFTEKSMPLLYLFIERYISHPAKKISDFVKGLLKDIDAVENAVASEKSNGFVEGTNSRIKMIKRTMFGRCGLILLSAKLMFRMWRHT